MTCPNCNKRVRFVRVIEEAPESSPPAPPQARERAKREVQHRKPRYWIVLVVLALLICAPFLSKLTLCAGVLILALVLLAFVPKVKGSVRRFLRLDPARPVRLGIKVAVLGLTGLMLLLFSWAGLEVKAEQQRAAARQAAERAEEQRLETEANAEVAALIEKAKQNLESGSVDSAIEALRGAMQTEHATEIGAAQALRHKIAQATDGNAVREALIGLSDAAFAEFQVGQSVPSQLRFGYAVLDQKAEELARAQVADAAASRGQRREQRLVEEKERQERARAAAEAARRAEEQQKRRAQAREQAAQQEAQKRLDAYMAALKDVGLVKRVSVRKLGDDIWEATLTVDNLWHIRHYQIRLQDAQTLWEAWARIASPNDLDKARISLVDLNGNEVGGSRWLAGSLIWVKKD